MVPFIIEGKKLSQKKGRVVLSSQHYIFSVASSAFPYASLQESLSPSSNSIWNLQVLSPESIWEHLKAPHSLRPVPFILCTEYFIVSGTVENMLFQSSHNLHKKTVLVRLDDWLIKSEFELRSDFAVHIPFFIRKCLCPRWCLCDWKTRWLYLDSYLSMVS